MSGRDNVCGGDDRTTADMAAEPEQRDLVVVLLDVNGLTTDDAAVEARTGCGHGSYKLELEQL